MVSFLRSQMKAVYPDDYVMGWELFNRRAIRKGDWKLLRLIGAFDNDRWELFNLVDDPGETNDLAEKQPQRVEELMAAWEHYEQENGVIVGNVTFRQISFDERKEQDSARFWIFIIEGYYSQMRI